MAPTREQGVPVIAFAGASHSLALPQHAADGAFMQQPAATHQNLVMPFFSRRVNGRKAGEKMRVCVAVCSVAALVCCVVTISGGNSAAKPDALLWDTHALEDASAEDSDLWGGRNMVANILRERSAHIATRVGRRFQDDNRIGEVMGHAAHVAFDTIVEIKRAMRGLQYESEDSVFNSKIEVAETMLAHLMSKLGISEVPPPPHTTRLATVKSAMRMARDLRMILSKIPTGNDARDNREARYNLAVYDLDQVSRQISEIMLDLSEDNAYQELQEPSFSRFDAVMADTKAGLADADEAFGGGQEHNAAWKKATFESRMNLLPKWKRNQEEFAEITNGKFKRLSQRRSGPNTQIGSETHPISKELPIESIIGHPSPLYDVRSGPVKYEIKLAPYVEEHARELEKKIVRNDDFQDPVVCVGVYLLLPHLSLICASRLPWCLFLPLNLFAAPLPFCDPIPFRGLFPTLCYAHVYWHVCVCAECCLDSSTLTLVVPCCVVCRALSISLYLSVSLCISLHRVCGCL